jgi:hypothetical protein
MTCITSPTRHVKRRARPTRSLFDHVAGIPIDPKDAQRDEVLKREWFDRNERYLEIDDRKPRRPSNQ